jgi:hypothetical protein
MKPKRDDIYWSTGGVIGWVTNVLEVHSGKDILDY